jgi:beta-lactamase class A
MLGILVLLMGDVLRPDSRTRLTGWLVGCHTGDQKIRAGLPKRLRGDKTD